MKQRTVILSLTVVAVCAAAYNVSMVPTKVTTTPVVMAAEDAPGPVPAVETSELMKLLIDPTFEQLKDAIETPPEARRDWRSLYIAAFNLAELNNLYFSRNDEEYMASPEWAEFSARARDEVVDLAKAVTERPDHTVLKDKFMVVMESCNECHAKFASDADVDEIEPPLSWQN